MHRSTAAMPAKFGDRLAGAKSKDDAELLRWILDQVRRGFQLHGWLDDERQAERSARRVWCELGRQERRMHALALQLGKGWVRFPRWSASLWALPWTPQRLGGVGTNPEYAVKSTDRFLTSLSRIEVEIKDKRSGGLLLKFWLRRSPLRPLSLPPWAEIAGSGLAEWLRGTKSISVRA